MATTVEFNPAAEFKALPLDVILAQPLISVVNAQQQAANATVGFIKSLMNPAPTGSDGALTPMTVDFNASVQAADGVNKQTVAISAPLLSIVPIPHLRIDSLTVSFKYELSQSITASQATNYSANANITAGTRLLPIFSAQISGNVTSASKQDSTTNRSGSLDIEMHASEAPIPEGLAKILNMLSNAVTATNVGQPTGGPAPTPTPTPTPTPLNPPQEQD